MGRAWRLEFFLNVGNSLHSIPWIWGSGVDHGRRAARNDASGFGHTSHHCKLDEHTISDARLAVVAVEAIGAVALTVSCAPTTVGASYCRHAAGAAGWANG